jgi:hypothetical protein
MQNADIVENDFNNDDSTNQVYPQSTTPTNGHPIIHTQHHDNAETSLNESARRGSLISCRRFAVSAEPASAMLPMPPTSAQHAIVRKFSKPERLVALDFVLYFSLSHETV